MRQLWIAVGAVGTLAFALPAALLGPGSLGGAAFGVAAVLVAGSVLVIAAAPGRAGMSVLRRARFDRSVVATPVREWLGSGDLGREEIVRLLDRIDRLGAHPNLPVRGEAEMQRFRFMRADEFLAAVARRLDEIEGVP